MSNFASAAMGRVLLEGMRLQGMRLPFACVATTGAATIRLDAKRLILQSAVTQGGLPALLQLGQGLKNMPHEPAYRALCAATNADDLMKRWIKLERYLHSHHRIQVLASEDRRMKVRHHALPGLPNPQAEDDLVVLSVLAELLALLGAQNLRVCLGDLPVLPLCDPRELAWCVAQGVTGTWSFEWQSLHRPSPPCVVADEPIAGFIAPTNWQPLTRKLAQKLATNLMTPAALAEMAMVQALSSRSLQRKLAQDDMSYSRLTSLVRSQIASHALIATKQAVAEIGFICGYSDQSHFTRDFKKRVGLTPAKFRESFAST